MAIIDKVTGFGNYGVNRQILDQPITLRRYIDTTAAGIGALASGDFIKIFKYSANTLIMTGQMITETVEGTADTIDLVDDTSGTTTLISNHDANTDNVTSVYTGSKFKENAEWICLKPDAAITAWKGWVVVTVMQMSTSD